jgi:hypothetical protein
VCYSLSNIQVFFTKQINCTIKINDVPDKYELNSQLLPFLNKIISAKYFFKKKLSIFLINSLLDKHESKHHPYIF